MNYSVKVPYAIYAVFDLAYNSPGESVQSRVVSDRQGIPARYLEQIFQQLRRAGLVTSKRGPGGGYTLALPTDQIRVRDIMEAMEGPFDLAPGIAASEVAVGNRPDFLWPELTARISSVLGEATMDWICQEAARKDIPCQNSDAPMYFI